jgi:26S proteasome regulatory subunit N10
LLSIPPGPHILSDFIFSSPIISGEDGPPPGLGASSGYEFGVDPNLDPELALVFLK